VQVRHRHLRVGSDIHHETITTGAHTLLVGDALGEQHQLVHHARVRGSDVVGAREVRLGDDQHVYRRLGVDVTDGQGGLALGHRCGGNLAGDDLAEKAITHVVLSSLLTLSCPDGKSP